MDTDFLIVKDFEIFCEYIKKQNPVLSPKKGVLGNKEAFKLNSMLSYGRKVNKPNYQQEHYISLDLLFNLALEERLFLKVRDKKDNFYLQPTSRLEKFQGLNDFEKYAFLLENYWTILTLKKSPYINMTGLHVLQKLFKMFQEYETGVKITNTNNESNLYRVKILFSHDYKIIFHLSYFELCEYDINQEAYNYDDNKFTAIMPTSLGKKITKVLLDQDDEFWKSTNYPLAYRTLAYNKLAKEANKRLYKEIVWAFPERKVKNTVDIQPEKKKRGSYYFKVALNKKIWRVIKMGYNHTFSDFHLAIQVAFGFDNDHLYTFYLDHKNMDMEYGIQPHLDGIDDFFMDYSGFNSEEVTLFDAGLYPGQAMLYVYDFGDMFKFDITLLNIDSEEVAPSKPEIVETKGEIPRYEGGDDFGLIDL